LRPRVVTIL